MSADRSQPDTFDFDDEMKHLANQAQARSSAAGGGASRVEVLQGMAQLVRPLALELEALKRSTHEHSLLLTAMSKLLGNQNTAPALENISQQMGRLGSVESANQKLFDALHAELKGYKDNFLFDALQKPFIRDLVSLFDDFNSVHEALEGRLKTLRAAQPEGGSDEIAFLQTQAGNVENQLHHMIEVFLRMEVELSKTVVGAPVDKRQHRIVGFEPAATEAEDGQVARSTKPGFTWRERSIRPEEIVARRWKAPSADGLTPPAPKITSLSSAS